MATAYESADLVLRLYELRREAKMREARDWYAFRFNPDTFQDIATMLGGPDNAYFRMVIGYWDMAAALVNHGAIDERLFADTNGEHAVAFAKIEQFLADLRVAMCNPAFAAQLERLVMRLPNVSARLAAIRDQFRQLAARFAAAAG